MSEHVERAKITIDIEQAEQFQALLRRVSAIEKWLVSSGHEIHYSCDGWTKYNTIRCDSCGEYRVSR